MKRHLYDIKLQYKFWLITFVTCFLICAGNLIAFQILQNSYNKELYGKCVQLLSMFASNVQSELDRVIYDSETMIIDDVLQESLSQLKENKKNVKSWVDAKIKLRHRIENIDYYSEDINYIYLTSADGERYGRFNTDYTMLNYNVDELVANAHEKKGKVIWNSVKDAEHSVILSREIREAKEFTLESLGTLIISVDLPDIVRRANQTLSDAGTPIQVAIYQGEELMYASDEMVAGLPVKTSGYWIGDYQGELLFESSYIFKDSGWTYVMALPYESIFQSVNMAIKISCLVLAGVMLIALYFNNRLTKSIIRHLEELTKHCDSFAKGEYISIVESYDSRRDEIGELYRHFDSMAYENQKMIKEIYVKQQLLLETEVSNLRAQIRPHFVYNTLESIYCLAQSLKDERIAMMTSALGKLLRTSLKEQRKLISLEEEIKMVEEYLKIQKIRYGDRLEVIVEIKEEYKMILVPVMSVQPLVENSIIYAMEEMLDVCQIHIYCRENGKFVEIVVEDNGPGMDTDIVTKLNAKEVVPHGLGIGLENINKRLKLLISEECGLLVERIDGWTKVIIRRPHMEMREEDV